MGVAKYKTVAEHVADAQLAAMSAEDRWRAACAQRDADLRARVEASVYGRPIAHAGKLSGYDGDVPALKREALRKRQQDLRDQASPERQRRSYMTESHRDSQRMWKKYGKGPGLSDPSGGSLPEMK